MPNPSAHFPPIPPVPEEIKVAVDTDSLYLFVGAGVSRLYGFPSWREMGEHLIGHCFKQKLITASQREVLLHEGFNSMQLVTIACNKLGAESSNRFIRSELSRTKMKGKANKDKAELVAALLAKFGCPIITTNADLSLDCSEPFKKTNVVNNFKAWDQNTDYNRIYHLHGAINDPESLVFTSQQYAKAYRIKDPFGTNLDKLLNLERTILFIGYGMNEFELIRYFLRKENDSQKRLFMLSGYLDKDEIKREFEIEYYKDLGITTIPYSIENNGYDSLIDVLSEWAKVIETDTFVTKTQNKTIKNATANPPTAKSKKEIERLL